MLTTSLLLSLLLFHVNAASEEASVKTSEELRQKILSLPRDCTKKNIAGLPSIEFDTVPYEKLVYAFQAFDSLLENLHSTPFEGSLKGMEEHPFMLENILEYVQGICTPSDSADTPKPLESKNEGATEARSPPKETAASKTYPIKANMEKPDISSATPNDLPYQNASKEITPDSSRKTDASSQQGPDKQVTQGEASTKASGKGKENTQVNIEDEKQDTPTPSDAPQKAKSEDDQTKKTSIMENPSNASAVITGDAQLSKVPAQKTMPNVDVQKGKSSEADKKAAPATPQQTAQASASMKDATKVKVNQTKPEGDKKATPTNQQKTPKVGPQPAKVIPPVEKVVVKVEPVKKEPVATTQTSKVKPPSIAVPRATAGEDGKKTTPPKPVMASPPPARQTAQAGTPAKVVNQAKHDGDKTVLPSNQQAKPNVEPQPTKAIPPAEKTPDKVQQIKKEPVATTPTSQVQTGVTAAQKTTTTGEDYCRNTAPPKPLVASPVQQGKARADEKKAPLSTSKPVSPAVKAKVDDQKRKAAAQTIGTAKPKIVAKRDRSPFPSSDSSSDSASDSTSGSSSDSSSDIESGKRRKKRMTKVVYHQPKPKWYDKSDDECDKKDRKRRKEKEKRRRRRNRSRR